MPLTRMRKEMIEVRAAMMLAVLGDNMSLLVARVAVMVDTVLIEVDVFV